MITMTDSYDYTTTWTFRKPEHFWKLLNKQMILTNLNDYKYKILLFSEAPEDFNDAITSGTGCLNTSATGLTMVDTNDYTQTPFDLGIKWLDDGENGFSLYLDNDSTTHITITEPFYVRTIALAKVTGSDSGSNYIVAYSRLLTPVYCVDDITLPAYCEFIGHSSCKEA